VEGTSEDQGDLVGGDTTKALTEEGGTGALGKRLDRGVVEVCNVVVGVGGGRSEDEYSR